MSRFRFDDRPMDAAELKRLRNAWQEGIPEYILEARHRLSKPRLKAVCADVPRPVKEPKRKQAPSGLGWQT